MTAIIRGVRTVGGSGAVTETMHRVHVAISDPSGRLMASVGVVTWQTPLRSCAKPFQALALFTSGAIDRWSISDQEIANKTLYKPRGCDYCTGTGFRGRIGVFEMMPMSQAIRELAFDRAPTNKIRKAAIAGGMKTLLQDGKIKVLNGTTTAEEIVKVAQVEGIMT